MFSFHLNFELSRAGRNYCQLKHASLLVLLSIRLGKKCFNQGLVVLKTKTNVRDDRPNLGEKILKAILIGILPSGKMNTK